MGTQILVATTIYLYDIYQFNRELRILLHSYNEIHVIYLTHCFFYRYLDGSDPSKLIYKLIE